MASNNYTLSHDKLVHWIAELEHVRNLIRFIVDEDGGESYLKYVETLDGVIAEAKRLIEEPALSQHAPELLEATKGLLKKLYEVAEKYGDRSCEFDVCEPVRLALKAIAKGEGRDVMLYEPHKFAGTIFQVRPDGTLVAMTPDGEVQVIPCET